MNAPADQTGLSDCQHWIGPEDRHCRSGDRVRRYITGYRCAIHTPNALQGKPEIPPGPGWPIHREKQ